VAEGDGAARGDERRRVLRALRQRLESLRRAGVDRIPAPVRLPHPAQAEAVSPSSGPQTTETPVIAPPPVVEERPMTAPVPPPSPVASLFDIEGIDSPPVAPAERPERLAALAREVAACRRCPLLAATRTQTVFGVGSPTARLMFIGEAPGADEDRQGEPFVGRAGMLLTDMITKGMGLARAEVYIANVLKSRPPENRNPEPDEISHCMPYLDQQVEIIRPEFLCLLGRVAASSLLNTALPLGRLRGRWHRYKGIATIVTYHPAYLLRNPADKKKAWDDLQMLMKAMGLTPPRRRNE
jgi:uracil-DNA glycosylase